MRALCRTHHDGVQELASCEEETEHREKREAALQQQLAQARMEVEQRGMQLRAAENRLKEMQVHAACCIFTHSHSRHIYDTSLNFVDRVHINVAANPHKSEQLIEPSTITRQWMQQPAV